jgi:hypothetical protein
MTPPSPAKKEAALKNLAEKGECTFCGEKYTLKQFEDGSASLIMFNDFSNPRTYSNTDSAIMAARSLMDYAIKMNIAANYK